MKKITALVLALVLIASNIFFLVSCGNEEPPFEDPAECQHEDKTGDGICDKCEEPCPKEPVPDENQAEIKVPEYKDYMRGTKNFSDLKYSRPDINSALLLIDELCAMIDANTLPYDAQLKRLDEINTVYDNVLSMNSLATICNYKDTTNQFWSEEYLYISTNYPKFSQGIEKLFVSAANSPHIESFEKDFFGDGLEDYIDGGIYTDKAVELMSKEAELEAEYSALSTANVTITYEGMTDTYDNILLHYENKYGKSSVEYLRIKSYCDPIYKEELTKKQSAILVELIKQRRLIADELGYESYEIFAYETIYHDYDPSEMDSFIESVTEYVIPIYLNLANELFSPYVYDYEKTASKLEIKKSDIINSLYDVYTGCDTRLGEIYSYMLQHKLYDVENKSDYRFDGAFTTYINNNSSPFIFITLEDSILDFSTLAHEFGHFADSYINNDASTSLDLSELSSQGLELLTLTKLDGKFDDEVYKYLLYMKLDEILSTIIFQSFYASFEIEAYKLDYEDITLENLNVIVSKNAEKFGISSSWNSVRYIMIPHLFLYPFYVQSYATSATAALEIYTLELKNEGAGFEKYNAIIDRGEADISFTEALTKANLTSPFEKNALKNIANELHYLTLGAYYYKMHLNNAA